MHLIEPLTPRKGIVVFLFLVVIPISCMGQRAFQDLDVAAFREKTETQADAILLDVRTPAEYQSGHIEGAINMDIKAPDFLKKVSTLDRELEYLVYCRSGKRSVTACNRMAEAGFGRLNNLKGGILAWNLQKQQE